MGARTALGFLVGGVEPPPLRCGCGAAHLTTAGLDLVANGAAQVGAWGASKGASSLARCGLAVCYSRDREVCERRGDQFSFTRSAMCHLNAVKLAPNLELPSHNTTREINPEKFEKQTLILFN